MNTSLHTSMNADSGIGRLARLHCRLYKGCSSWVLCFGPTLSACYDDETQAAAGLMSLMSLCNKWFISEMQIINAAFYQWPFKEPFSPLIFHRWALPQCNTHRKQSCPVVRVMQMSWYSLEEAVCSLQHFVYTGTIWHMISANTLMITDIPSSCAWLSVSLNCSFSTVEWLYSIINYFEMLELD